MEALANLGDTAYTLIVLLSCGALGGFLAGLIGVGGGIIFVPALCIVFIDVFGVDPGSAIVIATATSLVCMIPTSITSACSHRRRGNVDVTIIRQWGICMLIGVTAGALVSSFYGGQWLGFIFGTVVLANSLNTLLRANAPPFRDRLPPARVQHVIALCISFFSVMLGIGGGTLTVPVLNACGVPPHRSVGTSAGVTLFVCIPGVTVLLLTTLFSSNTPPGAPLGTYGYINLLAALCVIPTSMWFAPRGVAVGQRISPVNLKRVFALFLLAVALKMLHQSSVYYGLI